MKVGVPKEIKVLEYRVGMTPSGVKELVNECEKFAEESPYPEKSLMYDAVYEQEDYPFLKHKL